MIGCCQWLAICPVPNASLAGADVQAGEKLAGAWRLVRRKSRTQQRGVSWLLIKPQDGAARFATASDILEERPLSVISGRGIEAITVPS